MAGSVVVIIVIVIMAVIFSPKQDISLPITKPPETSQQPPTSKLGSVKMLENVLPPITSQPSPVGPVSMLTNSPLHSLVLLAKTRPLVPIATVAVVIFLAVGVTLGVVLSRPSEPLFDQTGVKEITIDEKNVDEIREESIWQRNMSYVIGIGVAIALVVVVILAALFWPSICSTGTSTNMKPSPIIKVSSTSSPIVTVSSPFSTVSSPFIIESSPIIIESSPIIVKPSTISKETSAISEEHLELVDVLRRQIDLIREKRFLPDEKTFKKNPLDVTNIKTNTVMKLDLPTILGDEVNGIPTSYVSDLNIFRSKYICTDKNDYSVILSQYMDHDYTWEYSHRWANLDRWRSIYLDLGKGEDPSQITDIQWDALEELHEYFNWTPYLEIELTKNKPPQ
jgi:hypothetical protein